MTINLVNDLWAELKHFIGPVDRSEAADVLINVLIDNDYDAEDIKAAFKHDNDVKSALQSYLADNSEDQEEEEEEETFEYDEEEDEY
jgi:hypothetical protein